MTALQPKFHGVTLACDDSVTILTYKLILVAISTVSGGLLKKYLQPYPLIYVRRGWVGPAPSLWTRRDREKTMENMIYNQVRQYSLKL